jgi:hypothetical protein
LGVREFPVQGSGKSKATKEELERIHSSRKSKAVRKNLKGYIVPASKL